MKLEKIVFLLLFAGLIVTGCINTKVQEDQNNTGEVAKQNISNLTLAKESQIVELSNNSEFELVAHEVKKQIEGNSVKMYSYNGQIPGPIIKVKQGSKIQINFINNLEENTTIHWHGIRLKNQFDGVPEVSQKPIKEGESFTYKLEFPDEGIYWYHPHVREDMQQELGMYGLIIVEPAKADYYNQVDLEEYIILDDILMQGNEIYPFYKDITNFALMGRYGNKILTNGFENYSLQVKKGQKVRLFLLNSANVRPFNFSIEGVKLKVVGSDSGKFEREFLANSIVIAPSERYIIEVQFNETGTRKMMNKNPIASQKLGEIEVIDENTNNTNTSLETKVNEDIVTDIDKYRAYFDNPADFEYALTIKIPGASGMMGSMMNHHADGIEWEDTMIGANRKSTNEQLTWAIQDIKTGKINMDAVQNIEKNQIIKIKITNDAHSMHPMQHPIHLHGARFLVVKKNNLENDNFAWKDTVMIPVGESVELLTYFPNEGEWMIHCHIAEHLSSGMMTSIRVGNEGISNGH